MFVIIDGKKIEFSSACTIMELAEKNGIKIPSLCYDKRFPHYTSCFVCIVKDVKTGRFLPSCSVSVGDGMEISTKDEEVIKYRKLALDLLLSEHDADCFSPCKTSCPAGIDVRDYIILAKNSSDLDGFIRIREKNPFVSVVGRVCPAFCEKDCSRTHLESSLAIRLIKRRIGDTVYEQLDKKLFEIEKQLVKKDKDPKKIAIIGSGPAGLSCAYYLKMNGHDPVIYEKEAELGGMLRYSIPEYRLPRAVLDREIASILRLGIEYKTKINVDEAMLIDLKKEYHKIVVSTGTWKESDLGLGETNYENVFSALSFLKLVSTGNINIHGKKAVVIGGGNSAIDSARTLLRLGFSDVSLCYRRTRQQMPAQNIEVEDALKEGVKLYELLAPIELKDKKISFGVMELSCELDSSGRKKICETGVKVEKDFDVLVYAIGQKAANEFAIDEKVLLCGDAKNGATSVIEAVSDGRKLAMSFCKSTDELAFYSERQKGILVKELNSYSRVNSQETIHRLPQERIKDFHEAELGFTDLTCRKEAQRCLDCGCSSIQDCSLRELSLEYKVQPHKFKVNDSTGGEKHFIDDSIRLFTYEASKCIKCGTCVRVCDKVAGVKAISFMGRGFDSKIANSPKSDMNSSTCILCGMCIDSCPTGALVEHISDFKREGLKEEIRECDRCILKCKLLCTLDNEGVVIRVRSYDTPICSIGRWGKEHYKGKISNRTIDISDLNVCGVEALFKATSVLCLNYDPYKDNPRMAYELNKLSPEVLNSKDLSQTVVIFNYFDPPSKSELKQAFAIIPVYYSGS